MTGLTVSGTLKPNLPLSEDAKECQKWLHSASQSYCERSREDQLLDDELVYLSDALESPS
jgi:hypothetical protein